MSTFLLDFVQQLDKKWEEVDLLLLEAAKHEVSNSDLYNALCRSITVLIVAHLEGFTKDLVKATIRDVNSNSSFDMLSVAMQRAYCRKYLGDEDSNNYMSRLNDLIVKFCEMKISVSYEAFLVISNKNPKPDTLKMIFKNFGLDDVFSNMHESVLDDVFSGSVSELDVKIIEMKDFLSSRVNVFPYQCDENRLRFKKVKRARGRRTLWEDFLDETNQKRHEVAHGNDFDNGESVKLLEYRKKMVVYLQLGLVELMAGVIGKKKMSNAA